MRLERPNWFEPVRGFGEWIGFLGGIAVACGIISLIVWNVVRVRDRDITWSELACIDPTDSCNWSTYRVQNDTPTAVVLRECLNECGAGDRRLDPVRIERGQTMGGDAVTALVGSRDWWEVRSASGQALGCLVLDGHPHKRDGQLVAVSSARSCS